MQKDGIKIEGHTGTWYIIGESNFRGQKVYLLEHETWGDESASLIINDDYMVILDDVYNGFLDLENL